MKRTTANNKNYLSIGVSVHTTKQLVRKNGGGIRVSKLKSLITFSSVR